MWLYSMIKNTPTHRGVFCEVLFLGRGLRANADDARALEIAVEFSDFLVLEFHNSVCCGIERGISPDPYVFAGSILGAVLAYNDFALFDGLVAEHFDPEALTDAIAAVLC